MSSSLLLGRRKSAAAGYQAGLLALRERRMRVTQADFKKSRDKVPS